MYYIGIDPGASGGIAMIDDEGPRVFRGMPHTEEGVPVVLRSCVGGLATEQVRIVIEKVGGYQSGARGNIGSAMFNFGRNTGVWIGALHTLGFSQRLTEVHPLTWQKELSCKGPKGEQQDDRKRRLKSRAAELFPSLVVTLKTADALLLAYYCRQVYGGKNGD